MRERQCVIGRWRDAHADAHLHRAPGARLRAQRRPKLHQLPRVRDRGLGLGDAPQLARLLAQAVIERI